MTTQAAKQKQKKKRAEKKKHEHETERMAEEVALKKRAHTEATVAIIALLMMVPFILTGVILWPAK
jgi:hypothetical protein